MPEGEGDEAKPGKGQQHDEQAGDLAARDAGAACVTGQTYPPGIDRPSRAGRLPPVSVGGAAALAQARDGEDKTANVGRTGG